MTAQVTVPPEMTASEMIEAGVGVIAQGLYRRAREDGNEEASADAMAVVDPFRAAALEFMRRA